MIINIDNIPNALLFVLFGNNLLKSKSIAALLPMNFAFSFYSSSVSYFFGGVHIINGNKNSTYINSSKSIIPLPIGVSKNERTFN